jgi:hypothetical protein
VRPSRSRDGNVDATTKLRHWNRHRDDRSRNDQHHHGPVDAERDQRIWNDDSHDGGAASAVSTRSIHGSAGRNGKQSIVAVTGRLRSTRD